MVEGGILYKGVCVCGVFTSSQRSASSPRRGRGSGIGRGVGGGNMQCTPFLFIVPLVVREAGGLSKLSSSDHIQFHGLTWVPTKEHRIFKLQ